MKTNLKYLLSELKIIEDQNNHFLIKLIDYEHIDYIEDVMIEKFDLEYDYRKNDPYILGFFEEEKIKKLNLIINQINDYHQSKNKLFETI